MQSSIKNMALMAASFAASASAAVNMNVRYTDNMIDVGTLDAFAATWQTVYATSGSVQGVVTDDSYQTDQNQCQTDDKSDLTVRVQMDGSWGARGQISQSDMRAAMVSTMWEALEAIWAENQYTVYSGCAGLSWQESVAYSSSAPCGPQSATSCSAACKSEASTPDLVQCDASAVAGKMPSTLKVTAYEDGSLLADELTVTFAATANDISDGGCGIVGFISEQLAAFVPVAGGLFAAGIAFQCDQ